MADMMARVFSDEFDSSLRTRKSSRRASIRAREQFKEFNKVKFITPPVPTAAQVREHWPSAQTDTSGLNSALFFEGPALAFDRKLEDEALSELESALRQVSKIDAALLSRVEKADTEDSKLTETERSSRLSREVQLAASADQHSKF